MSLFVISGFSVCIAKAFALLCISCFHTPRPLVYFSLRKAPPCAACKIPSRPVGGLAMPYMKYFEFGSACRDDYGCKTVLAKEALDIHGVDEALV
jgi:hypothetical protein